MAFSWDWAISFAIIFGLIIGFWAKMTGQTVGELFASIKDFILDVKDERGENLVPYYDG